MFTVLRKRISPSPPPSVLSMSRIQYLPLVPLTLGPATRYYRLHIEGGPRSESMGFRYKGMAATSRLLQSPIYKLPDMSSDEENAEIIAIFTAM